MNLIEYIDFIEKGLSKQKNTNCTVEYKQFYKNGDMGINSMVVELIRCLYFLKDTYRDYRLLSIRDLEKIDPKSYDEISKCLMEERPDIYSEIQSEILDKLLVYHKKNDGVLSSDKINSDVVKIVSNSVNSGIIRFINLKIKEVNDVNKEINKLINEDLKSVKKIQKLLEERIINIEEIEKIVKESHLDEKIKEMVIKEANVYFTNKEQERVELEKKNKLKENRELQKVDSNEEDNIELKEDSKVKLFNINNYDYIVATIERYEELFPSDLIGVQIEKVFSFDDLKQVLSFSFDDIDDEMFSCGFITFLSFIDEEKDEKVLREYVYYLNELCSKYEIHCNLYDVIRQLNDTSLLPDLSQDELGVISTFRARVENIKNSNNDNMILPILENMKMTLYSIKNESRKKSQKNGEIEIKAFVLFDYYEEDGVKKTYVLDDLNPSSDKNYIDSSVEKEKIVSSGYLDFNDLIEDIITLGNAEICLNSNDKMYKLVRPVYLNYDNHKIIDTKMSNSSGIYRIRPRLSSHLRFFDEKELFIPGTKKFEQVKELMCKRIPNIIIDDSKPLSIFINYQNAIKKKDMDSYSDCLKRQANSKIREVLKNGKDYFDDNELVILSDAIALSLDSYEELKKINDAFDFCIVDKISRNRHLG